MPEHEIFIHDTAVVDAQVSIGVGSKIWHFCHISEGATIGENCVLGQNVFIGKKVHIGNGVKIQNNVSIFEGVIIENEVFIGPSVVFTNILTPRAFINRKNTFLPTKVAQGASIGANSTIICGHHIGAYAMIGAGSVLTKNVGDYELWYGNPAQKKGLVNKEGEIG
ncbi:MAG: N-acetyltransferase [Sphingobacteriales bacterium]|nr:N-acetyltransferase [Sphingobacteriales bacterium]